jgi:hypothetical protein
MNVKLHTHCDDEYDVSVDQMLKFASYKVALTYILFAHPYTHTHIHTQSNSQKIN